MKLRIISGLLKNRYIKIPDSQAVFRPTKEMVRGAMADSIRERIEGSLVADFCAGSGSFGFEMLSRGARCVDFIDNDPALCRAIAAHAQQFKLDRQCRVRRNDITVFIKNCRERYDIIYYDPPYDGIDLAQAVLKILPFVSPEGILLYERRREKGKFGAAAYTSDNFSVESRYYGETQMDIYTRV